MLCSVWLLEQDRVHMRAIAAPNLSESYVAALDGFVVGPQGGSCGATTFHPLSHSWPGLLVSRDPASVLVTPAFPSAIKHLSPSLFQEGLHRYQYTPQEHSGLDVFCNFSQFPDIYLEPGPTVRPAPIPAHRVGLIGGTRRMCAGLISRICLYC